MTRRLSITMPDDVALELEELGRLEERSLSWLLTHAARLMLHDRRAAGGADTTKRKGKR